MDLWLWRDPDGTGDPGALLAALARQGIHLAARPLLAGPDALRTAGQPLLLWQATNDPQARARAFAGGADEIVGPWMDEAEALARLARRAGGQAPAPARLHLGPLEIDLIDHQAARDGQRLDLLGREYALLLHLARHVGRIQSREALLRAIWRLAFDPGTNVVEVHVSRLRAKLDRGFAWPMLRTVRGAGYALVAEATGG